jgi:hypothetical protein
MAERSVTSPILDSSGRAFVHQETSHEERSMRAETLTDGAFTFKPGDYEIDADIKYKRPSKLSEVTNVADLVAMAENDPKVSIQGKIMGLTTREQTRRKKTTHLPVIDFKEVNKKQFCSIFKNNRKATTGKYREGFDSFLTDGDGGSGGGFRGMGEIGDDFIPLLGGPFNKQLYYYDYLRMHSIAFHAFHHDPFGKRIVNIMNQFTLGKGFRVDVTAGKDKDKAMALWDAFAKVNNLKRLASYANKELSIYGEIMPWKLPNNQTQIGYKVKPGQDVPIGILPRWRLIDPSVIWEIVTYPEDIERVLYYQWVAPTQWQMYTGTDGGEKVPSTKFIVQQIPGTEIQHRKVNCVSNEKRGRSDLFAVLGYMKRMRDSVNYEMVAAQKNAAWSMDTTVKGSQTDIDNYIAAQKRLGQYAPAGSEFVHSAGIERKYNANAGGKGNVSAAFEWNMSMIAIGTGFPVSYFGSHLSGGSTRASALVSTEPVAKVFEERQGELENMFLGIGEDLFNQFGLEAQLEVTFPEIISQDRASKIKDIVTAEQAGYISPERSAGMCAKELGITDYDYDNEQIEIRASEKAGEPAARPLTDPALQPQTSQDGIGAPFGDSDDEGTDARKPSGVSSDEKHDIKKSGGF